MDEKSLPRTCPRKRSVKRYSSDVFQESSISAISNIVSASSIPKRVFRTLVLLTCLTGFLYQCITYLSVVFQYPTAVDVAVERPDVLTMPAFTFCDNNGVVRSKYCSKYPERCIEASEETCSKYPWYCKGNRTLMPKTEYFSAPDEIDMDDFVFIGQNLSEFLVEQSPYDPEEITGPFFRSKSPGRMVCYTKYSRVDSPLDIYTTPQSQLFPSPVAKFEFQLEDNEVFIPSNRAGVLFSVHSAFEGVNPYDEGYFLKLGRRYKIHVRMDKETLLPYPYETNCLNYTEIWLNNNKSGYRMQEMCRHKCLVTACVKCFECVPDMVLFPHTEEICNTDLSECVEGVDVMETIADLETCSRSCMDDCSKTKFTSEVQEKFIYHRRSADGELSDISNKIFVDIYLDGEEIVTFKHIPKYMTVEVFSNIGGCIGLWLGISLVQVNDLFESLFRIARYAFKSRRARRSLSHNDL